MYNEQSSGPDLQQILETEPGPRGIEDIQLNEVDLVEALKELSSGSSAGPDGIPSILLKECCVELSIPLKILWRKSMEEGKIPANLKRGIVTPIFKGGERSKPKNYRPITLTSHVVKIFEKVIVKNLVNYMESINVFNPGQHGFTKGRSYLAELLEHHHKILAELESNGSVDVVYLDFCKAFDKVDHEALLRKLLSIGVRGKLLDWISSFLLNRKNTVAVEGEESDELNVKSGVPQGSVLGPLLFLIMISDIDRDLVKAKASSFADDTRVLMRVDCEDDNMEMQQEINKIYDWTDENSMKFNSSKFVVVKYCNRNSERREYNYTSPDGSLIDKSESTKDLGVTMTNDAAFKQHIHAICQQAKKQVGWILRCFTCRSEYSMIILFKAMILPILEYCSQLWCPMNAGDIRKIENILRNYTSKISGLGDLDYWSRLKKLNQFSLERRRERYIILYVFKIIKGLAPNLDDERFKIQTTEQQRRGLTCKIPPLVTGTLQSVRTKVDSSFAIRGPKLFNCLPNDLRNKDLSYPQFKAKLDRFLAKIPDQPVFPHYSRAASSNCILHQLAQMRAERIFL